MAAFPPAAVTDATMLSSSDRAPDSTPTVPGGNDTGPAGTRSPERLGPPDTFSDSKAICRRSDSSLLSTIFKALVGGEGRSHDQPPVRKYVRSH